MTLKHRINDDMKEAMRAHDSERLSVIRMLMAAIKQREVDERIELTDADVLTVLDKMIKQRNDSVTSFEAGKRTDLADKERSEIAFLKAYLPAALSDREVDALIAEAIASTGASSASGIGKVMAVLKPKLAGRADLAAASSKVKSKLTGG